MTSAATPLPPSLPSWAARTVDRILLGKATSLDRLWLDPSRIMTAASLAPDPWQTKLLRSTSGRILLLCSRQSGKSTTAAALALLTALLRPPALILLLSPTQRQ